MVYCEYLQLGKKRKNQDVEILFWQFLNKAFRLFFYTAVFSFQMSPKSKRRLKKALTNLTLNNPLHFQLSKMLHSTWNFLYFFILSNINLSDSFWILISYVCFFTLYKPPIISVQCKMSWWFRTQYSLTRL